jgi:hypothetical protein
VTEIVDIAEAELTPIPGVLPKAALAAEVV